MSSIMPNQSKRQKYNDFFINLLNMNKTVLITGATSGIGKACAVKFAQGGYDIILTGRTKEKVGAAEKEILSLCPNIETFPLVFDVRDKEAVQKAILSLPDDWADIDVLINNAGLALGLEAEYEGDIDDWETMIDTNIKGLLYMTRLIVPGMVRRNKGHIINIGSVAGDAAYANGNVYCATKAAVKALSDGLRIDLAHTPLRVTSSRAWLKPTSPPPASTATAPGQTRFTKASSLSAERISQTWRSMLPAHQPTCRLQRCLSWQPTRPAEASYSAKN